MTRSPARELGLRDRVVIQNTEARFFRFLNIYRPGRPSGERDPSHECRSRTLIQKNLKVAEWYKGRMVFGGSGKVSFGRRIQSWMGIKKPSH